MAAGDAQRVWFPEMVERLSDQWRPDMPFEAMYRFPCLSRATDKVTGIITTVAGPGVRDRRHKRS